MTSCLQSFESFCCHLASLFPKLFCTITLTWSIFVIFFIISPNYIESSITTIIINTTTFILYTLCIFTYYRIIMIGPGSPLDYPELRITQQSHINSATPPSQDIMVVHTAQINGNQGYPYCEKCQCWKPDRTHHCSGLGKCILRMDHYCPWFSTCIGFFNHKFFVQFLLYVGIYCTFLFIITFTILYGFIWGERFNQEYLSLNLVILCVVSFAFSIAVNLFAGFSIYLILMNLTTIEFQQNRWNQDLEIGYQFTSKVRASNIYDLGMYENWKSIMGPNLKYWIFPMNVNVKSIHAFDKNGINFKVNQETYMKWCENVQLQYQLNQQLQDYKNRIRREREGNL